MNITGQIKIVGDGYAGGFSNGITMCESFTMDDFKLISESENHKLYRDDNRSLELEIRFKNKADATEVVSSFTNKGTEAVILEMMTSFMIRDIKVDKVHRLKSFWSAEGKLKTESITDLHLERSWSGHAMRIEKFGNVGSMPVRQYFPFIALEDTDKKLFTAVQLYIASSWQMELFCRENYTYNLCGGIADRNYGQWSKIVNPGETFTAPRAVIAQGKSLYDVCDKLVKAQNSDISKADESMDIIFNEYCTTWGNPTHENIKKIVDKIDGKGFKFFVIDAGWYGVEDDWQQSIGEWVVNGNHFPNGLKETTDYIRSKNMIPGLWFELENLAPKATDFGNEDLLVKRDGYPVTSGDRRFRDMENPKNIEYLTESVIKRLKENNFGYIKIDYNETIGMGCDGPESVGENLRRKVLASQNFFKKIRSEVPDIVIENCSSGGHRLEPSMMELVSQASFSDAHETVAIPIIAANLHRVIKPQQSQIWSVMRSSDSDDRIYYSIASTFLGRMCISGDVYNLTDHQWKLIDDGMDFYRKASGIIRDGKTILINNTTDGYNEPTGEQLVIREYQNKQLIVFHRFSDSKSIKEAMANNGISYDSLNIIESYGMAENDFSAMALIVEK